MTTAPRLVTVTLLVADYDAAIDFFVNAVGLELKTDQDLVGEDRFVVVGSDDGAEILLARADTPEEHQLIGRQTGGRVGFFLQTADFAGQHQRMLAAGVVFHESPRHEPYGTVAVFSDLSGNRWDLIERRY